MNFLIKDLSILITPAIVISATVYLIHLCGKIISDQKAFCDNRKWDIELSGLMFFVLYIFLPGLSAWVAAYFINNFGYNRFFNNWVSFIIILFVFGYLLLKSILGGAKYFNLPINWKKNKLRDEEMEAVKRWLETPSGAKTLFASSFISTFLIAITVYKNSGISWFLLFATFTFLSFIFSAYNFSLRTNKLLIADIYFCGNIKPIKNCRIIKINDDNVRLRKDDKIIILNKEKIFKIETKAGQVLVNKSQILKNEN